MSNSVVLKRRVLWNQSPGLGNGMGRVGRGGRTAVAARGWLLAGAAVPLKVDHVEREDVLLRRLVYMCTAPRGARGGRRGRSCFAQLHGELHAGVRRVGLRRRHEAERAVVVRRRVQRQRARVERGSRRRPRVLAAAGAHRQARHERRQREAAAAQPEQCVARTPVLAALTEVPLGGGVGPEETRRVAAGGAAPRMLHTRGVRE